MSTSTERISRLGLGTVQFGQDYGITNTSGRTPESEAHSVLTRAAAAGVRSIDTAPRYGDAEAVFGRCTETLSAFRLVTKTDEHSASESVERGIRSSLVRSLTALGVDQVHGLLEHRASALLGPDADAVWRGLSRARDEGLVQRIGVSVYAPDELIAILDRFPIEIVQVPANVLDRRFLDPDLLAHLRDLDVEVHARSVFLQGTLVSAPDASAAVPGLPELVRAFHGRCRDRGQSPLVVALGALLGEPLIDTVVVGVNDLQQLDEIIAACDGEIDAEALIDLACDTRDVIDPSRWRVAG